MTAKLLLKPHRRQFVLGTKPLFPRPDWQNHQLQPNCWLSYCPDLRINWSQDLNGVEWGLLGLAVETTAQITPERLIPQLSTAAVKQRYYAWAGRWLLIGDNEIHLDANGLLGCFYGTDASGGIWLSSSLALLAQIIQSEPREPRQLVYGQGISWYTPPHTGFSGVERLLPSQIFHLARGQVLPRPLLSAIEPHRPYEITLKTIKEALVTTLYNLGQLQQPVWLGLTAGYDSRLMLAIAKEAKLKFTTFTRIAERMSLADRLLPPKLAQKCRVIHRFLRHRPSLEQQARRALVYEHARHNVSAGDAEPFIMGVRDSLRGISFGGHGFAIASGFHTLRQLPGSFDTPQIGAEQIAQLFDEPLDSSAVAGLVDWLTWIERYPQPHLDWRDRFFLEQRQGGWLSSKEQVYDLSNLTRFPVLNAARTYALLLSIPEEQRLNSLIQVALLKQLQPQLLEYPFNPDYGHFSRWERWQLKLTNKLATYKAIFSTR
ncbi:MAG: hypothetical protein AAFQ41_07070 [Cyanobacteria bacterium J06623_7]